jgi:hypothetical protein
MDIDNKLIQGCGFSSGKTRMADAAVQRKANLILLPATYD